MLYLLRLVVRRAGRCLGGVLGTKEKGRVSAAGPGHRAVWAGLYELDVAGLLRLRLLGVRNQMRRNIIA